MESCPEVFFEPGLEETHVTVSHLLSPKTQLPGHESLLGKLSNTAQLYGQEE